MKVLYGISRGNGAFSGQFDKWPSGEDQTVCARSDPEGTVPEVSAPEVLFLSAVEFSSHRTEFLTVSFELEILQVANSEVLLQELQLAEKHPVHFETNEAVGIDEKVATLVAGLDDLTGGELGDGGFGFVHIDIIQPRGAPRGV